jgi:integrase
MPTWREKLTKKYCDNIRIDGEYLDHNGPVPGLIFLVGADGKNKSWLLRYRFRGKRREMGLGPYPEISLAGGRDKGGDARKLLADDIDPIEHRKQKRQRETLSANCAMTFKELADDWIKAKSKGPKDDCWRDSSKRQAERVIGKYLRPLHNMSPAQIDANLFYEKILEPMIDRTPSMMKQVRHYAEQVFKRGRVRNLLPADKLTPTATDGLLDELLAGFKHRPTPLAALHYDKIPTLMTALRRERERVDFSVGEAARAAGKSRDTIYEWIYEGRLAADKNLSSYHRHWKIKPADLFAITPQVVDVIPPPQTLASFVLEVSILTGTRPSETRMMRKSEYIREDRLWVIPWQRHKEGRKTRHNHYIPLAPEVIEIFELLLKYQALDGIDETEYMFANLGLVITNAKPGSPTTRQTVRDLLTRLLGQEFGEGELNKTWHAMRTAFRSWGGAQRRDGYRLYDNDVLERAINHIGGWGKTETVRIYNRQTPFVAEMVPLFEHWARYCMTTPDPDKILEFRRPHRRLKSAKGG